MPSSKFTYDLPSEREPSFLREDAVEYGFIVTLQDLKCRANQVKQIVNRIQDGCGTDFTWPTTSRGKTLTSFKASPLLMDNPDIVKCLFVVDRKGLDRQIERDRSKANHLQIRRNLLGNLFFNAPNSLCEDDEFARRAKAKLGDPARNGHSTDLVYPSAPSKKAIDLFNGEWQHKTSHSSN